MRRMISKAVHRWGVILLLLLLVFSCSKSNRIEVTHKGGQTIENSQLSTPNSQTPVKGSSLAGGSDGPPSGGESLDSGGIEPLQIVEWFDPETGRTIRIVADHAFVIFEHTINPTFPQYGDDPVIPVSWPGHLDDLDNDQDVQNFLNSSGATTLVEYPEVRSLLVKLPAGVTFDEAYHQWPQQYPAIDKVRPDDLMDIASQNGPNDPYYDPVLPLSPEQWYLHLQSEEDWGVSAEDAWWLTKGERSPQIYIAMIDTGIAKMNEFINGSSSRITDIGINIPVITDLNQYIFEFGPYYESPLGDPDHKYGFNWWKFQNEWKPGQKNDPTNDRITHGTRTASIVAAVTNNSLRIAGATFDDGTAPNLEPKVLPIALLIEAAFQGQGWQDDILRHQFVNALVTVGKSIRLFSYDLPVNFPNYSENLKVLCSTFVASSESEVERDYLMYLGPWIQIYLAAGNGGQGGPDQKIYPAYWGSILGELLDYGVLGVGATDANGNRAVWSTSFSSNYWPNAQAYAPGDDIRTISFYKLESEGGDPKEFDVYPYVRVNEPDYPGDQGTSMAAPLAAALGALYHAYHPKVTPGRAIDEIRENLKISSPDPGGRMVGVIDYLLTIQDLDHGVSHNLCRDEWPIDLVDSPGDVGMYASCYDRVNPKISYYDETNRDLKYAVYSSQAHQWYRYTVDSAGDVGQYTSINDVNSYPAISYYQSVDNETGNLKVARYLPGSGWSIQIVDGNQSGLNVGKYTSLCPGDYPDGIWVSYYDQTSRDLKFAKWSQGSWSTETVDSNGDVGQYTSIGRYSLDQVNWYPVISYYDQTNGDLKLAKRTASGWSIETVDDLVDGGLYTSLKVFEGDRLGISYYVKWDENNNLVRDLKFAKWNGNSWEKETVDSGGEDVGLYTSLQFWSGNPNWTHYPMISYYDETNQDLKFARKRSDGTWDIQTVDNGGGANNVGLFTSLVYGYGDPAIAYYDATDGDLKFTGGLW